MSKSVSPFGSLLKRGHVLSTSTTRKWSKQEWDRSNDAESLMVLEHFTAEDQGRSRKLICTCKTPEYASAIVLAVNNTYGAGINPEVIPDLLKALKFVTEDPMYLELDWKMRFTILAAIEKAKL